MTFFRKVVLFCDGGGEYNACPAEFSSGIADSVATARRRAKRLGWKRARAKTRELIDLCPMHAAKREGGAQ